MAMNDNVNKRIVEDKGGGCKINFLIMIIIRITRQ